jgi:hypothetical protein
MRVMKICEKDERADENAATSRKGREDKLARTFQMTESPTSTAMPTGFVVPEYLVPLMSR